MPFGRLSFLHPFSRIPFDDRRLLAMALGHCETKMKLECRLFQWPKILGLCAVIALD